MTPNQTQEVDFASKIIDTINNHRQQKQKFWKIICGANCWIKSKNNAHNKFGFSNNWKKLLQKQYKIMWTLQASIIKWVSTVQLVYKNPQVRKKYLKKYKYTRNNSWYPQSFMNIKDLDAWLLKIQANKNDILVFTDGSFSEKGILYNNVAGIGISIFVEGKRYDYMRPLGQTDILHAEQFAVLQTFALLQKLNINPTNKRIIIFTDNDTTYKRVYTNNSVASYPALTLRIKKQVFQRNDGAKIIVHKVKSHTEEGIYGNEFADRCAKLGRKHSSLFWTDTPTSPHSFEGSSTHYYTRCSEEISLWHPKGIG